jgi:putative hydrolase of the HAD superfamily
VVPTGRGFEGVLLDLFGTLVPAFSREGRAPHLYAMAGDLGVDPAVFEREWAESFRDRVNGRSGSLEETIRRISHRQGVEPSPDQVRRAAEVRLAFTRSLLDACGPVLPSIDGLIASGARLIVVSNSSEEAPRLWPSTELGRRIPRAVFSCVERLCKPDPRIYRVALERLGLSAERSAFVGDGGSHELSGADSAGLAAFRYYYPGTSSGPEARYDPDTDWQGATLSDLRDLLRPIR